MGRRAVIGEWYVSHEMDEQFEVVALDDETSTIDVQYFDGSIGEFDLETWEQLDASPCAAPDDTSGIYGSEFGEIDDTDESAEFENDEYGLDGLHIFDTSNFESHESY